MKKNSNGEGSITKYKNGYRASIRLGRDEETGKLIRKEFYGKTKREVQEKLNNFKKDMMMCTNIQNVTLLQYYKDYIENIVVQNYKYNTYRSYARYQIYLEKYPLGKMKLQDIKTTHFQKFFFSLQKEGVSPTVMALIKAKIGAVMNFAVKQDIIPKNYLNNVTLPKVTKNKKENVLNIEEQKTFLNYLKSVNHNHLMLYKFVLNTGVRNGELRALTWEDIDFEEGLLYINKSCKERKNKEGKWVYEVGSTKTKASVRVVPIPQNILSDLKKYKKEQNIKLLKYRDVIENNNLIFPNTTGGFLNGSGLNTQLTRILKKINIKHTTLHGLRHTYATNLINLGVNPKTVSILMGHSTTDITLDIYTHSNINDKKEAVKKIENIL